MGVSTDAIVAYGIELDENTYRYTYEDDEKVKSLGLEIIWHCSDEFPMYILAIEDSHIEARRGYPEKVTPTILDIYERRDTLGKWGSKVKEGMKLLGQEINTEPTWLLFSWWG